MEWMLKRAGEGHRGRAESIFSRSCWWLRVIGFEVGDLNLERVTS